MTSTTVNSHEQEAEPQEEWTRVRRKGRRHPKAHAQAISSSDNGHSSKLKPRPSFLSLSDIEKDHQHITQQWKSSTCCHQLREMIATRTCYPSISQAICFGLGSFDPENGLWEGRRIAHVQLAAFLCIVEEMQRGNPQVISCCFQEPLFNEVDRTFIRSLGHEAVDSPEGFERVTPSTLVFGIHLYRDIYVQTMAKHSPAMFVGTPYDIWEE